MDKIVLFDDAQIRKQLLPFTYTRAIADIRIGIDTIREKWQRYANEVQIKSEAYLQHKYGKTNASIYVNAAVIPNQDIINQIDLLQPGQSLYKGNMLIAYHQSNDSKIEVSENSTLLIIEYPWDIFTYNDAVLRSDFAYVTNGRTSAKLSASNTLIGDSVALFIEEGASIEGAILNTKTGCIYIGKDAEVMEGSIIRGPFAMCEHAATKLGTKIYGATTLGPHVKVGGEVNNSVIFGYSNKGHDGFLGNSVLGEWCNLGADTNNSNLKNNYGNVKVWSYVSEKEENTRLQFCGLMMGDHSKSGINTMFNTGTVVGVCANIFGAGFPPKHIPSFSWGGENTFTTYDIDKAYESAERMMERRKIPFTEEDKSILKEIFESTKKYRNQ